MDPQNIIKDSEEKMNKAVERTLREFSTLHTGKATPAMVEGVTVEAYGSKMKLIEVASVTTPDSRTIAIQPWDKGTMADIERAIHAANIGLNPVIDGNIVRCSVPELSKERRQELAKLAHGMAEDGRVGVRSARRDGMDALKKSLKEKAITEDDLKRHEKDVQQATDKAVDEIGEHLTKKEKELMQV